MPLFFVVSGMLFKTLDFSSLIRKKFKSLVVPYIVTCFLVMICWMTRHYAKEGQIDIISYLISFIWGAGFNMSSPSGIEPIGAIWFLLAMFGAQLLYNVPLPKYIPRIVYCAILVVCGMVLGRLFWLPLDLCVAMVAVAYLYLGEKIRELGCIGNMGWGGVTLLLFLWSIGWFKTLGMVSNSYPYYGFSLFSSFAGSLFFLNISKHLEILFCNSPLCKYLSYMGQYSLVILCFHVIELLFPWHRLSNSIAVRIMIEVILLSLVPIVVAHIPYLSNVYKLKNLKK